MATMSEHHKRTTNGVGRCSVPMWMGGLPAGFCDCEAFGRQTPEYLAQFKYMTWPNAPRPAYASGLACPIHGGPAQFTRCDATDPFGNRCEEYAGHEKHSLTKEHRVTSTPEILAKLKDEFGHD
jgi:hypothetical protein